MRVFPALLRRRRHPSRGSPHRLAPSAPLRSTPLSVSLSDPPFVFFPAFVAWLAGLSPAQATSLLLQASVRLRRGCGDDAERPAVDCWETALLREAGREEPGRSQRSRDRAAREEALRAGFSPGDLKAVEKALFRLVSQQFLLFDFLASKDAYGGPADPPWTAPLAACAACEATLGPRCAFDPLLSDRCMPLYGGDRDIPLGDAQAVPAAERLPRRLQGGDCADGNVVEDGLAPRDAEVFVGGQGELQSFGRGEEGDRKIFWSRTGPVDARRSGRVSGVSPDEDLSVDGFPRGLVSLPPTVWRLLRRGFFSLDPRFVLHLLLLPQVHRKWILPVSPGAPEEFAAEGCEAFSAASNQEAPRTRRVLQSIGLRIFLRLFRKHKSHDLERAVCAALATQANCALAAVCRQLDNLRRVAQYLALAVRQQRRLLAETCNSVGHLPPHLFGKFLSPFSWTKQTPEIALSVLTDIAVRAAVSGWEGSDEERSDSDEASRRGSPRASFGWPQQHPVGADARGGQTAPRPTAADFAGVFPGVCTPDGAPLAVAVAVDVLTPGFLGPALGYTYWRLFFLLQHDMQIPLAAGFHVEAARLAAWNRGREGPQLDVSHGPRARLETHPVHLRRSASARPTSPKSTGRFFAKTSWRSAGRVDCESSDGLAPSPAVWSASPSCLSPLAASPRAPLCCFGCIDAVVQQLLAFMFAVPARPADREAALSASARTQRWCGVRHRERSRVREKGQREWRREVARAAQEAATFQIPAWCMYSSSVVLERWTALCGGVAGLGRNATGASGPLDFELLRQRVCLHAARLRAKARVEPEPEPAANEEVEPSESARREGQRESDRAARDWRKDATDSGGSEAAGAREREAGTVQRSEKAVRGQGEAAGSRLGMPANLTVHSRPGHERSGRDREEGEEGEERKGMEDEDTNEGVTDAPKIDLVLTEAEATAGLHAFLSFLFCFSSPRLFRLALVHLWDLSHAVGCRTGTTRASDQRRQATLGLSPAARGVRTPEPQGCKGCRAPSRDERGCEAEASAKEPTQGTACGVWTPQSEEGRGRGTGVCGAPSERPRRTRGEARGDREGDTCCADLPVFFGAIESALLEALFHLDLPETGDHAPLRSPRDLTKRAQCSVEEAQAEDSRKTEESAFCSRGSRVSGSFVEGGQVETVESKNSKRAKENAEETSKPVSGRRKRDAEDVPNERVERSQKEKGSSREGKEKLCSDARAAAQASVFLSQCCSFARALCSKPLRRCGTRKNMAR
ncbi:hypothetical protein TGGT1_230110 [Toxoplasma gondii GT1]|uniref:Uncharacterized protein n=5 Tax=Toxoplasma gondii TaxID=5811 RepID=S7V2F2_TOXGG|nr:hypothetical protein TGGT1_230110 [Toxoplasma gondii GT1]KAF4641648.1 hypothetical protein TGRH88_074580 [Toxoplasma gondii]